MEVIVIGAIWPIALGLSLGMFVLWIWMLIDCITKEPDQGNDKIVWVLVIVLLSGLGALIYFFVRRPQRIREHGR